MGGADSNKLQVLEMSEENEFTWTVKAELPSERSETYSTVLGAKLWLIGGRVWDGQGHSMGTATVNIYDVANDVWATGPALPGDLVDCKGATTWGGEIYVSGRTNENTEDVMFRYRGGAWEAVDATGAPWHPYSAWQSLLLR